MVVSLSQKSRSRKKNQSNKSQFIQPKSYVVLIPLLIAGAFIGFSLIRTLGSRPSPETQVLSERDAVVRARMEKSQYKAKVDKTTKARATALAGTNPSEYLLKGLATAGRARSLSFQAESPEEWAEVEKLWLDAYALVSQIPYDHPDRDRAAAMVEDFIDLAFKASKRNP